MENPIKDIANWKMYGINTKFLFLFFRHELSFTLFLDIIFFKIEMIQWCKSPAFLLWTVLRGAQDGICSEWVSWQVEQPIHVGEKKGSRKWNPGITVSLLQNYVCSSRSVRTWRPTPGPSAHAGSLPAPARVVLTATPRADRCFRVSGFSPLTVSPTKLYHQAVQISEVWRD